MMREDTGVIQQFLVIYGRLRDALQARNEEVERPLFSNCK